MKRYYYKSSIKQFIKEDINKIKGKLTKEMVGGTDRYILEVNQNEAWDDQIRILKDTLEKYAGSICFEYCIPRCGRRIDNVLIIKNHLILLEFKVGAEEYEPQDAKQVTGYMKDLLDFHQASKDINIYSILVATEAKKHSNKIEKFKNYTNLHVPLKANKSNLSEVIYLILKDKNSKKISNNWYESEYKPTPTILEAAHALYLQNDVSDITTHGAGDTDIKKTTNAILDIIDKTRKNKQKSIIFVTGVPGSGKTLVGLNLIQKSTTDELYTYLSGNGPLVDVLQKELINDIKEKQKIERKLNEYNYKSNEAVDRCNFIDKKTLEKHLETKNDSNGVEVMINDLFRFRDEMNRRGNPAPTENVVIFDEAQRCWSEKQLNDKHKNGEYRGKSEAKALIGYMNRRKNWACVVALIGGGQEINTGEIGLREWFECLNKDFDNWNIYYSDKMIYKEEYLGKEYKIRNKKSYINNNLNLSVSMRSYKGKRLSSFIDYVINADPDKIEKAKNEYKNLIKNGYKLFLSRNLKETMKWVKDQKIDTESYGVITSSNGGRLRKEGVVLLNNSSSNIRAWFLNDEFDIRSCKQLEVAATEFQIQGLEIDYSIMAWDYDYYYNDETKQFEYRTLEGSQWKNANTEDVQRYIKNTYRVLLTRARQGMIIYVPKGEKKDITNTRCSDFFDSTYKYLKTLGMKEI